jgi:hypothetical protein
MLIVDLEKSITLINIMPWKKSNKYMNSDSCQLTMERCTAAKKLVTYKLLKGKCTASIAEIKIF